MFYYVEFQRAVRAIRVAAILIAIVLFCAIVLRLVALGAHGPEGWVNILESSPTAHVTTQQLPDGTTRTTIDDRAKRTHAVIERRGDSFNMVATMPTSRSNAEHSVVFGGLSVRAQGNGLSRVYATQDLHAQVGIGILFGLSVLMGLIVATILAGPLEKENAGHLELTWTKPVSRERTAAAAMAVDAAAIIVSQCMCVAASILVILLFIPPHFFANTHTLPVVVFALLAPIAWYACLTAAGSSLMGGRGMVVGLGWLAAIIIPGIAHGTEFLGSPGGHAIHVIFQSLAYIDPIAYVSFNGSVDANGFSLHNIVGSIETSIWALLAMIFGYSLAAVLQWRRVEA